jgi:hypothetical protein
MSLFEQKREKKGESKEVVLVQLVGVMGVQRTSAATPTPTPTAAMGLEAVVENTVEESVV